MDRAGAQRPAFLRAVEQASVHAHQAVRVGVGKRVEQHRFHHAEHGGVGADAKGQGDDGDCGEAGRAPEQPQRIADVLEEAIHSRTCAHVADLALQEFQAPQLQPGGATGIVWMHA